MYMYIYTYINICIYSIYVYVYISLYVCMRGLTPFFLQHIFASGRELQKREHHTNFSNPKGFEHTLNQEFSTTVYSSKTNNHYM